MSKESLYVKIENSIAKILFASSNANALTQDLLKRLSDSINKLSKDDSVSAILISSEGKVFCAGAALDELINLTNQQEATDFFHSFSKVLLSIHYCPKITICRVQGKVVGGGLGIASACDYLFATEKSSIKLSELSIGIAPMVIEPSVKRKMGLNGFMDLSLNPTQWQSAYRAKELGLYNKVFENEKDMDEDLSFFLEKMSNYSMKSLEMLKAVTQEDLNITEGLLKQRAEISGKLSLSKYCKEALEKYRK